MALACLQLNDEQIDYMPTLYFSGGSWGPTAPQAALNQNEYLLDEVRTSMRNGARKDPLQKYVPRSGGPTSRVLHNLEVNVPAGWQMITKAQGTDLRLKKQPYQELEKKLISFPPLLKELTDLVAEHNKVKCPDGAFWSAESLVPRPPLRNSSSWPRTLKI